MSDDIEMINPFASEEQQEPRDAEWAAKREIAAQTRRFMEHLMTCTTNAEVLNDIATVIAQQADRLIEAPRLFGRNAYLYFEDYDYGDMATVGYELNPLGGQSNPLAPPVDTWIDGDKAYGKANLGWHYEGPPNSVHGGFVAAVFDQFMGVSQQLTGQPGVTGTLTTRFIHPTPLCTDLDLVAYVEKVDGRKNFIAAEMWANDVMTASCKGLFITLPQDRFETMNKAISDANKQS